MTLLGLVILPIIALAAAFNRAHYGNKPLILKAGDQFILSNDGRWRVERHNEPAPVESDVDR